MVWLPSGVFRMGQDDSPYDDEKPAHEVAVSAFSIGQYPVTFEDYDKFSEATGGEKTSDGGWGRVTRPVINVSWEDATAYCEWLSEQTGVRYRLATEAEWEYACRAGSHTRYCFGDDEQRLGEHAWYGSNTGGRDSSSWGEATEQLAIVRFAWKYSGMGTGLVLLGITYEESPRENPGGPINGSHRVFRGGSWASDAVSCRSAFRDDGRPDLLDYGAGFRLARDGTWPSDTFTLARQKVAGAPVEAGSKVEQEKLYQPYEVFQDRPDTPDMVYLPGGTFKMGDSQGKGFNGERPVHEVTLDAFGLGRYPVTVGDFRRFVDATAYQTEAERQGGACVLDGSVWRGKPDVNWRNPYFPQADSHPVVCISWNDAVAYCKWLSAQTGAQYSLPTEAEWEYACRASSDTAYCFGDDEQLLDDYAWYATNAGGGTHPVGQKRANTWGLCDMHGNVWEWVQDWYGAYSKEPQNNPSGPKSGSDRVSRGGGWYVGAGDCCSAFRSYWRVPGFRGDDLGFRLARRV